MRSIETLARLDPRIALNTDLDDLEDAFRRKLQKDFSANLPYFLHQHFKAQILPQAFDSEVSRYDSLTIHPVEFETYAKINSTLFINNHRKGDLREARNYLDQIVTLLAHEDCDFGEGIKQALPAMARDPHYQELTEEIFHTLCDAGLGKSELRALSRELQTICARSSALRRPDFSMLKDMAAEKESIFARLKSAMSFVEEVLARYGHRWQLVSELGYGFET